AIAPVYGTGSGRVVGGGSIRFHHDRIRSAWLGNLHAGLSGMSASLDPGDAAGRYFRKAVPSVDLDLRCDPGTRRSTHQVGYRAVFLQEVVERDVSEQAPEPTQRDDLFHQLRYTTRQRSGLAPFTTELIATHHEAFTRAELVSEHAFMYDRREHRISLRLFAGLMLRTDPELMRREFAWRLHWGANDMLYDHLFVNRQDLGTLTDQQFAEYQGGFKTPNSFGTSDTWLASINADADLPLPVPLSLFVSGAMAPVTEALSSGTRTVARSYFEAGIGLRIVRDMFEIWFPLVFSQDIADQLEFRGIGPGERVRFILALEALDPFKLLRNMKP
ncbi:MAG: hypothetical protein KDB88_07005, partial [Flavobacteriales bacterium]|nr:hypothetical protein [Flavobacteriales bacterium]